MKLCRLGLHPYTTPGRCRPCRLAAMRRWYGRHRADALAWNRVYRAAHRHEIEAYRREWYWRNRDHARACYVAWRSEPANRERDRQRKRARARMGSEAWWREQVAA